MTHPTWREELVCVKVDKEVQYIMAMLIWARKWKQEYQMWPTLPHHHFKFSPQAKTTVKARVHTALWDTDMTLGESNILTVLTTMQYLAKLGLEKLGPEQVAECV